MSPSADDFPGVVEVVVEIPRGSRNKYEWDETGGVFRLDRVLSSAVFYNFDYGFVAGTQAGDGDHTDALLVIDEPTFTGYLTVNQKTGRITHLALATTWGHYGNFGFSAAVVMEK